MFVENATNFFINAYTLDISDALIIPDAGYIPLAQRIISLILVKIFGIVELYPFYTQFIAIISIAVFSSLINLNIFKSIHPLSSVRFILGISIGLISDYELNAFINFIYFGSILVFLGIFINKEKLHKLVLLFLTLIVSIIFLSKGQFVVFLPVFLLMAVLHYKKQEYKSLLYYITAVTAGFIQLAVMFSNLPPTESGNKLILLPYYFIKTLYYYFLTYKHVFLGYVTKDDVQLIGIGILLILFAIAIKKLLKQKNRQLLYIFIAGNFIALCSLFLTVYVLNNNVHPAISNLTGVMKNSSIPKTQPENSKKIIIRDENNKNIFEVKHFANLRSLFISNLLIFLTGSLVLLTLFPKKSQKILFLSILFYTSGAFGQIKVEEVYANQSQSFSQWKVYHHLLNQNQYCIPINHYPVILKHECDYLLYKNQDSLTADSELIQNITLSDFSTQPENWEIQAVILINKNNQIMTQSPLVLYAYDKDMKLKGKAKQLVPNNYDYIYYIFDKPISFVKILSWKTINGKEVKIPHTLAILGKNKNGPNESVKY